ncbi:hypothetical protein JXB11_01645, partial [Candidatus Woesearchaeota archaeon]|nr:hypothetical protein [Candidatus Woesearchaeota archaeon]
KKTADGQVRLETKGEIKEVLINESFMADGETISLCFRGKSSSGIIDLTPKEAEMLINTVKGRLHLIKGIRRLE